MGTGCVWWEVGCVCGGGEATSAIGSKRRSITDRPNCVSDASRLKTDKVSFSITYTLAQLSFDAQNVGRFLFEN